jgi:hypothetical protein
MCKHIGVHTLFISVFPMTYNYGDMKNRLSSDPLVHISAIYRNFFYIWVFSHA